MKAHHLSTIRLRNNAIGSEILKMTRDYDDVIIDCGGRDTLSLRASLIISDIFLIPFRPTSFEIWTLDQLCKLIEEAKIYNNKLIAQAFINCANSRGSDNEEAQNYLSKSDHINLLPVLIGQRKAFSNSAANGYAVIEKKCDSKADSEIWDLHECIFNAK